MCFVVLAGLIVACRSTSVTRAAELPADVKALLAQYQDVGPVYLKATVELIERDGAEETKLKGTVEYWADQKKFRISQRFDPKQGAALNLDAAYDGDRFQLLDKQSRQLSYSKEVQAAGAVVLNPFLYPFEFLLVEDDKRPPSLTLAAVRDAIAVAKRLDGAKADGPHVIKTPGGVTENEPYTFRVTFGEGRALPTTIERVGSKGQQMSLTEITAGPVEGAAGSWPKAVRTRGFLNGKAVAEMNAAVTELTIGKAAPANVFTLDFRQADAIWDDDARKFVQQKSGFRPPAPAVQPGSAPSPGGGGAPAR